MPCLCIYTNLALVWTLRYPSFVFEAMVEVKWPPEDLLANHWLSSYCWLSRDLSAWRHAKKELKQQINLFVQCIWPWPYPCSSCQQGTQSTDGFHKNGSRTSGCAMSVWWLSSWDLVLPWLRLGPTNLGILLWLQELLEWLWCPTSFL